jgi:hypothetical protein
VKYYVVKVFFAFIYIKKPLTSGNIFKLCFCLFLYEEVTLEGFLRIIDTPCMCRVRWNASSETKRGGHVVLQVRPINMTFARTDSRNIDNLYTNTNWNRAPPHQTGNDYNKRSRERRSHNCRNNLYWRVAMENKWRIFLYSTHQQDKFRGHPHPTSPQVDTPTEKSRKEVVITNTQFHIASTWLPS